MCVYMNEKNHCFHGPTSCFQNRTGPEDRTVKIENQDENWFFKPKEPDVLLIP